MRVFDSGWPRAGYPFLPKRYREAWNNDPLPDALIAQCKLPAGCTYGELGADVWGLWQGSDPPGALVEHVRTICSIRLKEETWRSERAAPLLVDGWDPATDPLGLPFSTRTKNLLRRHGLAENRDRLGTISTESFLGLHLVGISTLLDFGTVAEAHVSVHNSLRSTLDPEALHEAVAQLGNQYPIDEISSRHPAVAELGLTQRTVLESLQSLLADGSADLDELCESVRRRVATFGAQPLEVVLASLLQRYAPPSKVAPLARRLGWDGGGGVTLAEAGRSSGIARERLRQLEKRLKGRLSEAATYMPQVTAALEELADRARSEGRWSVHDLSTAGITNRPFHPQGVVVAADMFNIECHVSVLRDGRLRLAADAPDEVRRNLSFAHSSLPATNHVPDYVVAARRNHPRAYFPWERNEEALLLDLQSQGLSIRAIAVRLQRSPGAIRSRLERLLEDSPDYAQRVHIDVDGIGSAKSPQSDPGKLLEHRAVELLRIIAGEAATFHPDQYEAIEALVDQRRKALVVQRTGWGKSAVYLIATKLLREQGAGPTLIVSPLLALMRNQIEMTTGLGLNAATVNSTNRDDWDAVFDGIAASEVDLLLISPERLNNPKFVQQVLPDLTRSIGLLVIDEVHCISDWGHDFRPDYRRLGNVVGLLPRGVPVLGTTATANDRVVADVASQLGSDLFQIRGTLDRESLELHVINLPDRASRLAWLAAAIPGFPGSGIVYCLTIRDANRVGKWLRQNGIDAETYTGKTDPDERLAIEERLTSGSLKVVVATSALGMGYDNPHIEFAVHYQSPGSPIAYYQQVGRAGRAVPHSYGVLLAGSEDVDIQDYFIRTAFPTDESVRQVLSALSDKGGMKLSAIDAVVNVPHMRLQSMLKILEVEGAVYQENGTWFRSAQRWEYPAARVESVTAQRKAEQAAMIRYQESKECLLQQLRAELDDPAAEPCGRCGNCTGRTLEIEVADHLVESAVDFLNRTHIVIRPRRRWPAGYEGRPLKEVGLSEGRALTVWGDPGLAQLVEVGKYRDGKFDDRLVDALSELIVRWSPEPAPEWVTWVPAFGGGGIVADVASRLGHRLDLPVREVVTKTRRNRPQKTMQNPYYQARNVRGAFRVDGEVSGRALLVDDVVDSRWTLTVIGSLLREAGASTVYPVALADSARSGQ